MRELIDPIPIITGDDAFNCPNCNVEMVLRETHLTPEGHGVGVWSCGDCKVWWWEDGDEWYATKRKVTQ